MGDLMKTSATILCTVNTGDLDVKKKVLNDFVYRMQIKYTLNKSVVRYKLCIRATNSIANSRLKTIIYIYKLSKLRKL